MAYLSTGSVGSKADRTGAEHLRAVQHPVHGQGQRHPCHRVRSGVLESGHNRTKHPETNSLFFNWGRCAFYLQMSFLEKRSRLAILNSKKEGGACKLFAFFFACFVEFIGLRWGGSGREGSNQPIFVAFNFSIDANDASHSTSRSQPAGQPHIPLHLEGPEHRFHYHRYHTDWPRKELQIF